MPWSRLGGPRWVRHHRSQSPHELRALPRHKSCEASVGAAPQGRRDRPLPPPTLSAPTDITTQTTSPKPSDRTVLSPPWSTRTRRDQHVVRVPATAGPPDYLAPHHRAGKEGDGASKRPNTRTLPGGAGCHDFRNVPGSRSSPPAHAAPRRRPGRPGPPPGSTVRLLRGHVGDRGASHRRVRKGGDRAALWRPRWEPRRSLRVGRRQRPGQQSSRSTLRILSSPSA